ncbi:MAG: hypothetical protein ABSF55_01320 [Candidatus Staskawiczbacteria bacterium]
MVICCSQLSYEQFVAEELGLRPRDIKPICVPGGPAALVHQEIPKDWVSLRDWVRFLLAEFQTIENALAFGHEGCGYYRKTLGVGPKERDDLLLVPRAIMEYSPRGLHIRTFYAKISGPNGQVDFEEVK